MYLFGLFFAVFSASRVEGGVAEIKIAFVVERILSNADTFGEALVMHNFALPQEADRVDDVGIVAKAKNVVIGHARLLLCCKIFVKIGEGIPLYADVGGGEGNTGRRLRIDASRMIHEVGVKTAAFDLLFAQPFGELIENSGNNFAVGKFFCARYCIGNEAKYIHCGQAVYSRLACLYFQNE